MTTTARRAHDRGPAPHREATHRTQPVHRTGPSTLNAVVAGRSPAKSHGAPLPCREYDAELWFAESPADVELAKSLCATCPALAGCLAGALERREPWGVWGGQLLVQGVVVARKRPRGRPRKNEIAA